MRRLQRVHDHAALGPTIHPDMGKQAGGGEAVRVLQAAQGSGRSTGRLSLIARKK